MVGWAAPVLALLALVSALLPGSSGASNLASPEQRVSGRAFLSPDLLRLQDDPDGSPIGLWLQRGQDAWTQPRTGPTCVQCHGRLEPGRGVSAAAVRYPRLDGDGVTLINLEDQIRRCLQRSARPAPAGRAEDDEVLALSAWLHGQAKGLPIAVRPPLDAAGQSQWQQRLEQGRSAYGQRMGRMNLACVHCHDLNVGKTLRGEVVSPGHPTGFPVYRMRWQTLGSQERRLRACFSGVQADVPDPGDPLLRSLELFLKVRAEGMPLEGPSIRR